MGTQTDNDNSIVSNAVAFPEDSEILQNPLLEEIQQTADLVPAVRRPDGTFAKGNQLARNGAHSPAKRVAAFLRAKLAACDPKDAEKKSVLEKLYDNLILIASDSSPKTRKEAIWAFNALMERAFGAPTKSEEELDAIAQGGVKIVVISPPILNPAEQPKMPAYIDGPPVFDALPDGEDR